MKHLFILNDGSLKAKEKDALLKRIEDECRGMEYEIYLSPSARDGKKKARDAAASGAEICIYAGGGDGTIHQIAEEIYRYPNVTLSALPIGTGNDFIRNFASKKAFMSLSHIRDGLTRTVDMIRVNDRACINMVNIGFDESVVARVDSLRSLPLMGRSIAYTIGLIIQLIRYPRVSLHIELEDGTRYDGKCLLTFAANGKYCGGGYKAASLAELDDNKMDVLIVHPVSRLRFLSLVGMYKKGTLLGTKYAENITNFYQTRKMTISKETPFDICLDGEILSFQKLTLEMMPSCIHFKYPKELKI